ncbi:MAG: hypothetical protein HDR19_04880 [Lachnospiraceae bacterium]|nr:hypothetical protein [Lachnospiraceae bacterium]
MYDIISLKKSPYSNDDFDDANKIKLGQGRFYYVLKNGIPFLRVEVDLTSSSFDTAVVFYETLCIGVEDKVFFIDMNNFICREICVQMYFGYFYTYKNLLLVLSGNGVIAFDNNMHEKWRQPELAVDGMVVNEIENDNVLVLSCEMDPPGGWITKRINIFNGKEM